MPDDNLFPPVDAVSSMVGPHIVVSRRRWFGQRSRELYNQLLQDQKELRESAGPAPPNQPPVSLTSDLSKNIKHFNQLF
jgi:hypothetical protein